MKRNAQFVLVGLSAILILIITLAFFQSVSRANQKSPCRTDECAIAKQTNVALQDTGMIQTAEAIPTTPRLPTFTMTPVGWASTPTPNPTAAITQLTGDYREIPPFRGVTDAWTIGSA